MLGLLRNAKRNVGYTIHTTAIPNKAPETVRANQLNEPKASPV